MQVLFCETFLIYLTLEFCEIWAYTCNKPTSIKLNFHMTSFGRNRLNFPQSCRFRQSFRFLICFISTLSAFTLELFPFNQATELLFIHNFEWSLSISIHKFQFESFSGFCCILAVNESYYKKGSGIKYKTAKRQFWCSFWWSRPKSDRKQHQQQAERKKGINCRNA